MKGDSQDSELALTPRFVTCKKTCGSKKCRRTLRQRKCPGLKFNRCIGVGEKNNKVYINVHPVKEVDDLDVDPHHINDTLLPGIT